MAMHTGIKSMAMKIMESPGILKHWDQTCFARNVSQIDFCHRFVCGETQNLHVGKHVCERLVFTHSLPSSKCNQLTCINVVLLIDCGMLLHQSCSILRHHCSCGVRNLGGRSFKIPWSSNDLTEGRLSALPCCQNFTYRRYDTGGDVHLWSHM